MSYLWEKRKAAFPWETPKDGATWQGTATPLREESRLNIAGYSSPAKATPANVAQRFGEAAGGYPPQKPRQGIGDMFKSDAAIKESAAKAEMNRKVDESPAVMRKLESAPAQEAKKTQAANNANRWPTVAKAKGETFVSPVANSVNRPLAPLPAAPSAVTPLPVASAPATPGRSAPASAPRKQAVNTQGGTNRLAESVAKELPRSFLESAASLGMSIDRKGATEVISSYLDPFSRGYYSDEIDTKATSDESVRSFIGKLASSVALALAPGRYDGARQAVAGSLGNSLKNSPQSDSVVYGSGANPALPQYLSDGTPITEKNKQNNVTREYYYNNVYGKSDNSPTYAEWVKEAYGENDTDWVTGYVADALEQAVLGSYTDKNNALGLAGQIGLGFLGLDLPADIRDLVYDLQNWEWSSGHMARTGLDLIALLPIAGALKYGDEAAVLSNGIIKNLDEGEELVNAIVKNSDEAADFATSVLKGAAGGAGGADEAAEAARAAIKAAADGSDEASAFAKQFDDVLEGAGNIKINNLDEFFDTPTKFGEATPEQYYKFLQDNGFNPQPLGSKSSLKGLSFEQGGGFRINWGGDRYLQYHPSASSHHGGAYWKLSSGPTGTLRFDLNGNLIP